MPPDHLLGCGSPIPHRSFWLRRHACHLISDGRMGFAHPMSGLFPGGSEPSRWLFPAGEVIRVNARPCGHFDTTAPRRPRSPDSNKALITLQLLLQPAGQPHSFSRSLVFTADASIPLAPSSRSAVMRRALLVAPLVGLIAFGAVGYLLFSTLFARVEARDPVGPAAGQKAASEPLPLGQIVLFSSGVGYFQREGTVERNTRVDLSFAVQDINDLLKSMVIRHLDGGLISTVAYDSNAPVEKTLKSFAINLNGDPSFGAILNQARGEKVEVVLQQTNATQPGTLTGTIIGMEAQKQPAGKDATVNVELLNLWCADGMRSLKLSDVQRVRCLHPLMDSEVKRAPETLAP